MEYTGTSLLQHATRLHLGTVAALSSLPIVCEAQADYAQAARNAAETTGGGTHITLSTPDANPGQFAGCAEPIADVSLHLDITFPPAAQELEGPSPDDLQTHIIRALLTDTSLPHLPEGTQLTWTGISTLNDFPNPGDYTRRLTYTTTLNLLATADL